MATIRVLSIIAAITASTAFVVIALATAGFFARSAMVLALIKWCPLIPLHHEVGVFESLIATALLGAALMRIRGVVQQRRWAVAGTEGHRIQVLDTDQPIAYAAPGNPGCVVVSNGLLGALDVRGRQVLFAHERAHLHQNHHRYLLLGAIAVAVVPPLRPLVEQLRLATERAADEAAVEAMEGDRELVAVSIARAALATTDYAGTVGAFGGGSIPFRVNALLDEPLSARVTGTAMAITVAVAAATVAASSVQLHHFVDLAGHICGR
ncbi:MAG: M56 family metallopeptidase [Acidimicrobiia bacterium]|nr:M56 family metallopeptidase [Acidimicrobiia bacterium]